jgi:hypothetical protein
MGVPTSEVGYTSATTGRGDHEVHNGHVVALEKKEKKTLPCLTFTFFPFPFILPLPKTGDFDDKKVYYRNS